MNNVLNTINHTTVEALGFKFKGERFTVNCSMDYHADPDKRGEITMTQSNVDVFTSGDLSIHLYDTGAVYGTIKGERVDITLEGLKRYLRSGILN